MKFTNIIRYCYTFFILICIGGLSTLTFSQTTWYKYPGNPLVMGPRVDWDYALIPKVVVFDNDQYHMWYRGWNSGNTAIGYATSRDGIQWKRFEGNPLKFECDGIPWDTAIYSFDIIKKDSVYYMWYTGRSKADNKGWIGFAYSPNGLKWTKLSKPVMKPSKNDSWDAMGLGGPQVEFDGLRYHMWYNGFSGGLPVIERVGYATSYDGISWKKNANPVLDIGTQGSWEDHSVSVDAIVFNGTYFEMWYHGWNLVQHEIGYAYSGDGVNWTKSPLNPVLKTGALGTWDAWLATRPAVIIQDTIYRMWYQGHDNSVGGLGYATTSASETSLWETGMIHKSKRVIRVKVFNNVDYINVDSLAGVLNTLSGTALIDVYNKLALAYSLNDGELSLKYAEMALSMAEKINYPLGKAMAQYSIANNQYVMDNYSDALVNQLDALRLFDSLNMVIEQGNLLSQIAGIHSSVGSYDLAIKYHYQALKLFEVQKDTGYLLNTLIYLGHSYLKKGDTAKAIKAFNRRLQLAIDDKKIWKQVEAYEALGLCFTGHFLDSALYYFSKARAIWDTLNPGYLAYNYMLTAEAYCAAGPHYYSLAEENYLEAYGRAGNGRHMQVRLIYDMAELYFSTGNYAKALEYLGGALNMCRNYLMKQNHQMFSHLNDKLEYEKFLLPFMEKIYWLYYRIDTALVHNDLAFNHFILATQWKDSIIDQQNKRQWAMLLGQYETESAQNQISILEKDNNVARMKVLQSRIYLFVMGGILIIISLMALLFIRQNKIRAENKTVVLEQKLLRLQMNPHFIFNALSNILNFINRNDTTNASTYLTSFSRLLRTTLENSREDYIVIEEEIRSIKNYLDLQLLRYEDKFDYSVVVDKHIDIENAIIPPMLIQPFIENAIEHGIRHKQDKGHVFVRFSLVQDKVICEVEDDGIGREKAWETEYQKKHGTHKSLATEIISDRIVSLNKKFRQKIVLKIIDLKTEGNIAAGTKVVLNIPYLID